MSNEMAKHDKKMKMLIVDDEAVICEGLRWTIDWEDFGVDVVGVAYDGNEALQLVQELGVDLVLSDIRMDGMDGLQLAEQLKLLFPEVRMIIISGYEDFEYARQAMRLGVSDYLLKPVDIEELTAVVEGIVSSTHKQVREGDMQEAQLWLSNMARNGAGYSKEAPQFLHGAQFRILAAQIADFHEQSNGMSSEEYQKIKNNWIIALHQHFEEYSFLRMVSIFDHENLLITLLVMETRQDRESWEQMLTVSVSSIDGVGPIYYGASDPYDNLDETVDRCAEAIGVLPYYILERCEMLLPEYCTIIRMNWAAASYDTMAAVQKLIPALFKQDMDELMSVVKGMFCLFREDGLLLHEILGIYEELFALLRQRLRKSGMTGLDNGHKVTPDLNIYNSYEGLQIVVLEDMTELLRLIDKNGIDKSYWIIEKAKKFIEDQCNRDLKASEVASWLKITPSYFSFIFKQSTGKGFTEYMNEKRIDHAKKLLATTHDKVFEIADQAGYKEYKYFVSVFKSYTGMTPKEYRGLIVNNSIDN